MKIIYTTKNGRILEVVEDYRWYWWKHSINIPFDVLDVPEIEANRGLCLDVKNSLGREPEEIYDYRNYKAKDGKLTLDDVVVSIRKPESYA